MAIGTSRWLVMRCFTAPNPLANKSLGFSSGSHGRLLLSRARCGGFHCVHNVLVPGAAAEVAFEPVANLVFAGRRVTIENLLRSHNHSRRAESALQSMLVPESFL